MIPASSMNSPPQNGVQKFRDSGITKVKVAAVWLCLVALATVLNSLILFKYSRFVDFLIGLSFTQFIDAVFVGMQLEPPGSPWWVTALPALVLDLPFVSLLLVLAAKVLIDGFGLLRSAFGYTQSTLSYLCSASQHR